MSHDSCPCRACPGRGQFGFLRGGSDFCVAPAVTAVRPWPRVLDRAAASPVRAFSAQARNGASGNLRHVMPVR